MRKDFLNITAKLSKRLRLQKLMYGLCRFIVPRPVDIDTYSPEKYLAAICPEKSNSCIQKHQISENPNYDLQIIIPTYNVSRYIDECIMSVLSQKTKYSFLLVVVDDGSSDNTPVLLEKYVTYPNVKIIYQRNQGPSAARNKGLQYIDARYVTFIDADDSLPPDAIETLIAKADALEVDMLEGSHRFFMGDRTIQVRRFEDKTAKEVPFSSFAWGKIYRAELWRKIGFPVGYWFEDMMVMLVLSPLANSHATIHEVIYNYRDTPTGFTRAYNHDKRRVETYWVTKQLLTDAKELHIPATRYYYERFLRCCMMNTHRVAILGDRKADYALFEAQRQLREQYFSGCQAVGQKEKRIESAFLNDDFKEYFLYCLFLH